MEFFYNFDDATEELSDGETFTCEESLPYMFEDGNFELVDGLIVLVDKPNQKKLKFKTRIVPRRRSQCASKAEIKPRAA